MRRFLFLVLFSIVSIGSAQQNGTTLDDNGGQDPAPSSQQNSTSNSLNCPVIDIIAQIAKDHISILVNTQDGTQICGGSCDNKEEFAANNVTISCDGEDRNPDTIGVRDFKYELDLNKTTVTVTNGTELIGTYPWGKGEILIPGLARTDYFIFVGKDGEKCLEQFGQPTNEGLSNGDYAGSADEGAQDDTSTSTDGTPTSTDVTPTSTDDTSAQSSTATVPGSSTASGFETSIISSAVTVPGTSTTSTSTSTSSAPPLRR